MSFHVLSCHVMFCHVMSGCAEPGGGRQLCLRVPAPPHDLPARHDQVSCDWWTPVTRPRAHLPLAAQVQAGPRQEEGQGEGKKRGKQEEQQVRDFLYRYVTSVCMVFTPADVMFSEPRAPAPVLTLRRCPRWPRSPPRPPPSPPPPPWSPPPPPPRGRCPPAACPGPAPR